MFLEIIKFIIYSALIVLISKYILVTTLRKLAESLKLKPKTVGNIDILIKVYTKDCFFF